MSNLKKYISIIIFIIFTAFALTDGIAGELSEDLRIAEEDYNNCFNRLPAKVRWSLKNKSARGKRKWSQSQQVRVEECVEKQRTRDDNRAIIALSNDLQSLQREQLTGADKVLLEKEANQISSILVKSTRSLNKKYKMANAALWHNFLIKIGAKEGGYCYHWAEEFLNALPTEKYSYFERYWGVRRQGKATENNAVVIAKRGDSVQGGIVYDAWRGKGRPFWRFVSKDKQKWKQLFTEPQILAGAHIVTPE